MINFFISALYGIALSAALNLYFVRSDSFLQVPWKEWINIQATLWLVMVIGKLLELLILKI